MFKWLFHILIFATSGKYQNKEKSLKRQRKLGLPCALKSINEPAHVVLVLIRLLSNEGPDEHAQKPRFTRALSAHIHKVWM